MNINHISEPPRRRSKVLTVLSLCTGIGGDVAAFELAGIPHRLVAVAERDPAAAAVLSHKFPGVENLGDITQFSNWSKYHGKIDILIAGIPCQPFSVAGKQKGAEDRRDLTTEVAGIVQAVCPRYVFIENVTHYRTLHNGRAFRQLAEGLCQAGYAFDYRVIDAAEVVAQRRRRLFILGHRGDAGATPSEVFTDAESRRRRAEPFGKRQKQSRGGAFGGSAVYHPPVLGTLMASGSGLIRTGMKGHDLDFLVVQRFPDGELIVRRPSLVEALRAQGFPDDWLDGVMFRRKPLSESRKGKLIGNAWPVPVAASILGGIYEAECGRLNKTAT